MRRRYVLGAVLFLLVAYLMVPALMVKAADDKPLIFDEANLLSPEERDELNAMANEYGAERETDFMILTVGRVENDDYETWTENFYDEYAPGYDRRHGNTVILTIVLDTHDVHLEGYYKAEKYLDSGRLLKIQNKITPDLSRGNYKQAFEKYIKTAHRYMGFEPDMNPDNILFNLWFQLGSAAAIGAIAVGVMAYRSGGRVTVNSHTYEDTSTSGILNQQDRYVRTTVTKQKIERNTSSGSGGGGGGGVSSGGHSHSSSSGKF
ncbi:TPM domain-containing protein [Paenibacillus sp. ISL-20]|uniref:TPM domain-containing protein n=1 Tax=Paenibacillus sp. ISL-20 TaxID=2819163 RepID=UPI001BEA2D6B|nr:TPM domain-containing protein [Paenibacillus sp. ISL-20]